VKSQKKLSWFVICVGTTKKNCGRRGARIFGFWRGFLEEERGGAEFMLEWVTRVCLDEYFAFAKKKCEVMRRISGMKAFHWNASGSRASITLLSFGV
jgi:hypothetical protein